MAKYTTEQLRAIFQRPFDQEAWKTIVRDVFKATSLRSKPERFTLPDDPEQGYYFGAIDTPDNYRIGVFFYKISHGSVAHKKVGLRNLVKKFVNTKWGEFDAALVVFSDGVEWRLSFVCDIKEVATAPKRFTFVFGENDNFYRTAIERFNILQEGEASFENIRKAFSVDALSDGFFDQYRELYADFCQYITGKRYVKSGGKWVERELNKPNSQYASTFGKDDKLVRDYIKKMFGRIVFLYFLQRKGWLAGNRQYMHDLFYKSAQKDNFLDDVLEPLFFDVLNTDENHRTEAAKALPGEKNIPYLNGGLFAQDEVDVLDCVFPENYFKRLFDFLDSYNFTIDENDTDDAEVGIDPEMLGRIFENLLEDNKDKGAFYTPKVIVDYMCRESIIAYLGSEFKEEERDIRRFVETLDANSLDADLCYRIRRKLQVVKICDPAIGSGAFPMGLVNLLSKLYVAMKADTDTVKMKRHIMENNIYGVDIERGAVDIARLRFWLAMIVEETEPQPLPNLHFKIMQGNSLLEYFEGQRLTDLIKSRNSQIQESSNEGQQYVMDYFEDERKSLITDLNSYYSESDHKKRDFLLNGIKNNIIRQLANKDIKITEELDPSANDKFFLWHTWFADVFDKGGFDIVIGNPPYISTKGVTTTDKKLYEAEFGFSDDTYNLFFFKGYSLLAPGGCLCYITPKTFWTTQTKRNLRDLILSNKVYYIFDTANPFESAMVDTCITSFIKAAPVEDSEVIFLDGSKDLSNPEKLTVLQKVYLNTQNSVIFKPSELNMKIYNLYGEKVKELYDKWWDKIKTSRDIEKNKQELEQYRASLKPGDVALLGCLTEGGQGLATANNGKYIAVRKKSKWAKNILSSRPKKLTEFLEIHPEATPEELCQFDSADAYLSSLKESEIADLFDDLKERYGRDVFGQGYIYRLIDEDEIADVNTLTKDEKENGIPNNKPFYVPYDKGDKDGNRWYLETPFAIAWTQENVRFLKTNSGKKGQGMPVVRNPQFYFREGLCWSDINTVFLKCRKKQQSIHDVKSMSIFAVANVISENFIMTLINTQLFSYYVDTFVNNTQTFQINDARQLPIIIPNETSILEINRLVDSTIDKKSHGECIDSIEAKLEAMVRSLYGI